MKKYLFQLPMLLFIFSCAEKESSHEYTSVEIQTVFEDSVSIRAIEFLDANTLSFAGSNGMYGTVDVNSGKIRTNVMRYDSIIPEFRAVAHTASDFFMLSVGSPALLYKTGDKGQMELVYKEEGEGVFYDSMTFWDNYEGIAVGDAMNGCLSIIKTKDGGKTWNKIPCSALPEANENEGAFAASNTNVKTMGNLTWIATSAGRVYFSSNRGENWSVDSTPMSSDMPTTGIYSIDFYNPNRGMAVGGNYTEPEKNSASKMYTTDAGNFWRLVGEGQPPGYKSCVQFVPNGGGTEVVAIGFTGISYSTDAGSTWKELSGEGFYTLRFLNDSVAYAAGRNRIAKLLFK